MNTKHPVVIIGFGWVGQANAIALAKAGFPIAYFDVAEPAFHYKETHAAAYENMKRLSEPLEIDGPDVTYVICVGDRVDIDGTQDISTVKRAIKPFEQAAGRVVLRSTILAKHLADLQFDYYYPEFLHERYAVEECIAPHLFVLGLKSEEPETDWPGCLQYWKSSSGKHFVGSPEQASYIKYLSNIWNGLRIGFVNEIGDLVRNYTDTKGVEEVINFFFEGKDYLKYGKAYGGYCLPKDVLSFFAAHKKEGRNVSIIQGAHESNLAHRAVERAHEDLPEWYARWANGEGGRPDIDS